MSENKTKATAVDPTEFLMSVDHPTRRADAQALDEMFRGLTGWAPRMWGPTIIGYGSYHYKYDSGREGTYLATGFSPRKANLSLYIMPGYAEMSDLLDQLGKHKMGKSCLYINKLSDVDMGVVQQIVRRGLDRLSGIYPVQPS